MRRAMLGGLAVLALLGSACGGDDDESSSESSEDSGTEEESGSTASRGEYVESIATSLVSLGIPEADTQCTAEVFLDVIGLEPLQEATSPGEIEAGTAPPAALGIQLDDADRVSFYQGVNGCFDVREYFFSTVSAGDQAVRQCLEGQIDDATIETVVVTGWLGPADPTAPVDGSIEQAMTAAYTTCSAPLTPPETAP